MDKLSDYNKRVYEEITYLINNDKTGVACDNCGHELHYTDKTILTSHPPQREVKCSYCGLRAYIVVEI